MGSPSQYLNELYHDISYNSPQTISRDFPSDIGKGHIYQTKTKQGAAISDWHMNYGSDANVQGVTGSGYMQMMFCFKEGVAWETAGKPGLFSVAKGQSCFYRCTDEPEHICYPKGRDFHFKSIKIPVGYLGNILDEYFETDEKEHLRKQLLSVPARTTITAHMEKTLCEMFDFVHYKGGLGFLYLESKTLELISVYLSELLGLSNAGRDIPLSAADMEALIEAKRIIDSRAAAAPGCESLAKRVNLSTAKFTKGFLTMYGMPVHTYIIDKRLEKAAALLMERRFNVGQVAMLVGYSNASHFAGAFKRKYGISPKQYMNA